MRGARLLLFWLCLGIAVAAPAETLRVTLLGTGTPRPILERFGPSILVEAGEERLLFDTGRGVSQRLWQLGMPLRNIGSVFLTHFHSDHVIGLPDLWLTGMLSTSYGGRTGPLTVYGPPGTQALLSGLESAYAADLRIRMADEATAPEATRLLGREISEGVAFERNGVKVTAFDVDHGELIKPAMGYRVDYAGRAVVLSGDTRFSENLIRHAAGADLLLHEVAAARPEFLKKSAAGRRIIGHHTEPEQAGVVFERVRPRLALYTHIALVGDAAAGVPDAAELERRTRRTWKGPLTVGEDLMRIEVGETITVHRFGEYRP